MGHVQALTQAVDGRGLRRIDVRILILVMRESAILLRAWIWVQHRLLYLFILLRCLQLLVRDLSSLRRRNCHFEILVFELVLVVLVRTLVASPPLTD